MNFVPDRCKKRTGGIQLSQEQKKEAALKLCTRTATAKDEAKNYGVTRGTLYHWRKDLFPGGGDIAMTDRKDKSLPDDHDALLSEIEELKFEKDILQGQWES